MTNLTATTVKKSNIPYISRLSKFSRVLYRENVVRLPSLLTEQIKKNGLVLNRLAHSLMILLESIRNGEFLPFYKKEEIDTKLKEEVLKGFKQGKYYNEGLKAVNDWEYLIREILNYPSMARSLLINGFINKSTDKNKAKNEMDKIHNNLIKLKIIEDWFYYNKNILEDIVDEFDRQIELWISPSLTAI